MGYGTGHNVTFVQDPIYWYCEDDGLPPFTSLVILKYDGMPGDAFVEAYPDFPKVQAKVYNYDWYAVYPPTAEEFAELIGR
jgi:hypothetical protein